MGKRTDHHSSNNAKQRGGKKDRRGKKYTLSIIKDGKGMKIFFAAQNLSLRHFLPRKKSQAFLILFGFSSEIGFGSDEAERRGSRNDEATKNTCGIKRRHREVECPAGYGSITARWLFRSAPGDLNRSRRGLRNCFRSPRAIVSFYERNIPRMAARVAGIRFRHVYITGPYATCECGTLVRKVAVILHRTRGRLSKYGP